MFCTNCGTQLPDEAKFCTSCGASLGVAAPVAAEEPVYQEPVYQQQEPVYQQEPVPAAPVYEEPVYAAPVYEEPVTYADPVVPAPPKKKKKTGLIVGIILLVLVLAAGGVLGFLYYQDQQEKTAAYEDAMAKLEARDYDGALAIFQELEDFKDAADQAAELTELQADYDAAMGLLDEHKYEDAVSAFKKLKDYRDSKEYVDGKATYLKGIYFKESAPSEDMAAWCLAMGYDSAEGMAVSEGMVTIDLYEAAADIFTELGDYSDSADQASECWLGVALVELKLEYYDIALEYMDKLNEEDAAALLAAYNDVCVDDDVLAAIEEALLVWYDDAEAYSLEAEIVAAINLLESFRGGEFSNDDLEYMYEQLLSTLNSMYLQVDEDDVLDMLAYYKACIEFLDVTASLCEDYGTFGANSDMFSYFTETIWDVVAYYTIEESLQNWYNNVTEIPHDDDIGYYVSYYNDTDYTYVLYIRYTFEDDSYNTLGVSDVVTVTVTPGQEIQIPTGDLPEGTQYVDWEWAYELVP